MNLQKQDNPIKINLNIVIIAALVLGIMFFFYFIKPAYIGYSIYKEIQSANGTVPERVASYKEITEKLVVAEVNSSSVLMMNDKLFAKLEKSTDELKACNENISKIRLYYEKELLDLRYDTNSIISENLEEIEDIKEESGIYRKENEKVIKELTDKNIKYESIIQSTANNICCKAMVDNPDITFYYLERNKIVCSEDSGNEISCTVN